MNEQEFYRDTVQNQIVNDDAVRRFARNASEPARPAFRRVLTPVLAVLASLLLVFGVLMTIPTARAEVLSWFTQGSAKDYLAADPEDRVPQSDLDAMVTSTSETEIRVNYIADEPYWREIGDTFSAVLGSTIYDGKSIYIAVDFNGLSGYPVFENERCPSIPAGALLPTYLAEKVDPEMVKHFFEDDADLSAYRNGDLELWNGPENRLILTTKDGAVLYGHMEQSIRPVDAAFLRAFHDRYGFFESYDETTAEAWREQGLLHCKENGARAVADVPLMSGISERFSPDNGKTIADYIDENGFLTLYVRYRVTIPRGETSETKLDADLGTVKVNMTAYRNMRTRSIDAAENPIALSGDAVFEGHGWDADGYYAVTNYTADLDGVKLLVSEPGYVDLLGVHDLGITVSVPQDWSEPQKEAFAKNLSFDILIDGEPIGGSAGFGVTQECSGDYTIDAEITEIPFERINAIRTITLLPRLTWYSEAQIQDKLPDSSETAVRTVPIGPGETFSTAALEPGTSVQYEGVSRTCPEYAITLTVN